MRESMRFDLRDWLRAFVLRTNGTWPFRACNRLPYFAAVRLLVNAACERPEIESVYVSHGMAGSDWTPGMSDIDLTVILTRGLAAEEECDFLEWFWGTYDRLKRYFPMLGEVVILDEGEFQLWQIYSSTTAQGRNWMLVHGRETAGKVSVGEKMWRARALNSALWVYLESLLPCLSRPDSYLRQQDLARRARKISRYLEPVIARDSGPPLVAFRDFAEIVAHTVKLLEAGVRAVTSVTGAQVQGSGDGICGVISTHNGLVLTVLEGGLDPSVIGSILRARGKAAPAPIPYCVFAYMIRQYNPFLHAKLAAGRTVISGRDPFEGVDPPDKEAFATCTMDRIAYLLTITRGEELFSACKPFSLPELERAVNDGLAVGLLLREGRVGTDPGDNATRFRSRFPESYRALEEIRGHVDRGRERDARRASFRLFRPIAADICGLASGGDSNPAD